MLNNIKNYYYLFFIIFFFPSFVGGVALTNYFIGLFLFFNLIFNSQKLIIEIKKNYHVVILFSVFYFLCILSSYLSQYPLHSFRSSVLYFILIIFLLSIVILFNENKLYRKIFLISGLTTCLILSIDGLFELYNGTNIFGNSSIEGRIGGLFGDRWLIGRYLVYILPILIGIYFLEKENNNKVKFLFYVSIILSSITIIFSGERAAFILFFIYLLLVFFFILKKISFIKISLLLILILSILAIPLFFTETSMRLKSNLLLYLTSSDLDKNQYLSLFLTAWNMFIENIFLGVGPNNFRLSCQEDLFNISIWSCSTHPHSLTLQLLAEMGILGFLIVVYVLLFFSFQSLKLAQKKVLSFKDFGLFSITVSLIIYLFPLMITGNFFLSWYGYIYYLPISLFIIYKKETDLLS
jgi:O-antigen ligase